MTNQTRVSFIGAGKIGSALALLVSHSGSVVEQWDVDASKVPNRKSLEEVVSGADVLFFCVPSWVLIDAIKFVIPFLGRKTLCVFVSKGIETKSKLFIDGFAKKSLPKNQPIVLLSGPMLADELMENKGGAACVGTKSVADYKKIEHIFSCDDLHLTFAPDVKSVAVAGVLKNVYAIALGVAAGLEWGDNRKGWLITEILQEMILIMQTLKADPSYVLSQVGVGDFIATGMSSHSMNQTLGREFAENSKSDRKSEGRETLSTLVKLLGLKTMKSLPILSALDRIIEKGSNAKNEFEVLFSE